MLVSEVTGVDSGLASFSGRDIENFLRQNYTLVIMNMQVLKGLFKPANRGTTSSIFQSFWGCHPPPGRSPQGPKPGIAP